MSTVLKRSAIIIIALSAGFSLYAQQATAPFGTNNGQSATPPPKPSQLDNLRTQYQHDVQAVVKPIHDGYISILQAWVKTLTQNRYLDQALAVEQELKAVQAEALPNYVSDVGDAPAPASGLRSQLDVLKSDYRTKLRMAIKPMQGRYVQALNGMLNSATQNGDLDGALAIRDELKKTAVDAQPAVAAQNGAGQGANANGPGLGWYYVQTPVSGLYLNAASHNVKGHINQAKKNPDQLWKFIADGKGNYFIQSKVSEFFLDPKMTDDDNIDQVEQAPDIVWKLIPDGNGNYFIQSTATGKNLDVANANTSVGGKIHQAPQDTKQVWKLIEFKDGL